MYTSYLRPLALFTSIFLLPHALASAAAQYHLDVGTQGSKCFVECHEAVIASVNLTGKGANSFYWIQQNCQFDSWLSLMPLCLVDYCTSAPDVAYAVEYGESFCSRAGVKGVKLSLPTSYLESDAAEYFSSSAYLSASSAILEMNISPVVLTATATLLGAVLLATMV